jgi:hypothetical protein
VSEIREVWPERGFREREWVTVFDAINRVDEPSLRELLKRIFNIDHGNPRSYASTLRIT